MNGMMPVVTLFADGIKNFPYSPPQAPPFDVQGLLLKLFIWAAVVIGGMLVVVLLAWRHQKHLAAPGKDGAALSLCGSLKLAANATIHLIDIHGHKIAVGVDSGGIKQMIVLTPSFQDVLHEAAADREGIDPPADAGNPNRGDGGNPNEASAAATRPATPLRVSSPAAGAAAASADMAAA